MSELIQPRAAAARRGGRAPHRQRPAPPGTAVPQAPATVRRSRIVLADRRTGAKAPTFSKHALDRLARRGVDMNTQTLGRLTEGIQRAADKGARNSVVFVDGTAFVTSVQNNTVITAVTPEAMNSHVFTNIDSAVIA